MAVMQIQEGDIVYLTCDGIPFCYHLGVAVVENGELCLYHNTPSLTNRYGGNIVCQPIREVLKNRKILSIRKNGANCPNIVREYAYENRARQWNTFTYNCEDFVTEILKCRRGSTLRVIWMSCLIFAASRLA